MYKFTDFTEMPGVLSSISICRTWVGSCSFGTKGGRVDDQDFGPGTQASGATTCV